MQTETLRGKVGAPVTGVDEFFDREKELALLMEKLSEGRAFISQLHGVLVKQA